MRHSFWDGGTPRPHRGQPYSVVLSPFIRQPCSQLIVKLSPVFAVTEYSSGYSSVASDAATGAATGAATDGTRDRAGAPALFFALVAPLFTALAQVQNSSGPHLGHATSSAGRKTRSSGFIADIHLKKMISFRIPTAIQTAIQQVPRGPQNLNGRLSRRPFRRPFRHKKNH